MLAGLRRNAWPWILIVVACNRPPPEPGAAENAALRDSLVAIIDEWERAFEPQVMNETEANARAMVPFIRDSTFAMVIDGLYYPTWQARADTTPLRIRAARSITRETRHVTSAVRFLRLGRDAAAITMPYRYEFTRLTGQTGYNISAYTMVFVRTPQGWRVAQYHGSHGREVLTDSAGRPR